MVFGVGCSSQLGPRDGLELPPNDFDRVKLGDKAPDFVLEDVEGGRVALSDYQGKEFVILVFYRGHW